MASERLAARVLALVGVALGLRRHGVRRGPAPPRDEVGEECVLECVAGGRRALLRCAAAAFTLEPGDLLLTGTPAGVGPVVAGDRITAGATGFVEMAVDVVAEGGGA